MYRGRSSLGMGVGLPFLWISVFDSISLVFATIGCMLLLYVLMCARLFEGVIAYCFLWMTMSIRQTKRPSWGMSVPHRGMSVCVWARYRTTRESRHKRARGPKQPIVLHGIANNQRVWACLCGCMIKGAWPTVPGNGPNFASLVVVCTSAYGRPLTSLSFVCLGARDLSTRKIQVN